MNGEYLTQERLFRILEKIKDPNTRINSEVRLMDTRYRIDYVFMLSGNIIFVEFDGERHYRDLQTIFNDEKKESILSDAGSKLVRIPYFVQPCSDFFKHYFNYNLDFEQSYPHGFIDSKAHLPASFCERGLVRFTKQMQKLPTRMRIEIGASLKKQIEKKGAEWVMPSRERFPSVFTAVELN